MSTSRDTISTLLASNEKFASTFNGTLAMEQLPAGLRTDDGQPLFIRGLTLLPTYDTYEGPA